MPKMLEQINLVMPNVPKDANDAISTGDYVSMAQYARCLVVALMGDGTAGSDLDIVLYQATTAAGAGAKVLNCLETGRIYRKSAADFATLAASTTGVWTKVTQATADEQYAPADSGEEVGIMAVEIMASDLDQDGGFDWIRADFTDPGAAKLCGFLYILGEPRNSAAPELMEAGII